MSTVISTKPEWFVRNVENTGTYILEISQPNPNFASNPTTKIEPFTLVREYGRREIVTKIKNDPLNPNWERYQKALEMIMKCEEGPVEEITKKESPWIYREKMKSESPRM